MPAQHPPVATLPPRLSVTGGRDAISVLAGSPFLTGHTRISNVVKIQQDRAAQQAKGTRSMCLRASSLTVMEVQMA
jgi:hypothetical protein